MDEFGKFDYLMKTARSMLPKNPGGAIVDDELKKKALNLYVSEGGTFSSDEEAINFMIYFKPGEVANLIFKEADSIGKPIRNFIELLPAGAINASHGSSQCGKASRFNPKDLNFRAGQTFCWLCGCPIAKNPDDKNRPECEHIIPALRATMTVGMFSTAKILDKIRQSMGATLGSNQWKAWNSETANNYLWAHSACNQSSGKGAMVLLGYDAENGVFNFNAANGDKLQEKIYNIIASGVIKPIPKQCQGQNSCYQRNDGGNRMYGNCTNVVSNEWDSNQEGCVKVNQPYDAYAWEMNRAAVQVNQVWAKFGGNIRAFAEYCLMQTKLYLSAEGLRLAMSEKERLEAILRQKKVAAKELAEYKDECAKAVALIVTQIEIIKKLHKLSAETLMITANDEDEPISKYVFSGDLIKAKSRFNNQIKKIFTVYCRNSSNVHNNVTEFVNRIMIKFFADEKLLSNVAGGNIGPGGVWTEDVRNMMEMLVQTKNAERILTEYISCLVLFNIRLNFGWKNVAKIPHPITSTRELAAILYPYPNDRSSVTLMEKQNRLRGAFVQNHNNLTPNEPPRRTRRMGNFEKLMNNIFQTNKNFVLPAFDSERACDLYLMQLFTILVGSVITNMSEAEWGSAFELVISNQNTLLTRFATQEGLVVSEKQQDVQKILNQSSKQQMTELAYKTVAGVLEKMITTNPILNTFLTQAPEFKEFLKDEELYKSMVPVIGCNLMQRMLSVTMSNTPLANFLTMGQNIFCGQLGIDTTAIKATASAPQRSEEDAIKASKDPDLIEAQREMVVDNPAWKAWQHRFQGGRKRQRTIKKRRGGYRKKTSKRSRKRLQKQRRKRRTIKKRGGKYRKKKSKRNRKQLKTQRRKNKHGKKIRK